MMNDLPQMTPQEASKSIKQLLRWYVKEEPLSETVYMREAVDMAVKALDQQRWIPVSERLPKENEYIGNVCKYYLIQDEYGDMHVAHLSNVGWIPMDSLKAIGDEVIAWMPLPQPYKECDSE